MPQAHGVEHITDDTDDNDDSFHCDAKRENHLDHRYDKSHPSDKPTTICLAPIVTAITTEGGLPNKKRKRRRRRKVVRSNDGRSSHLFPIVDDAFDKSTQLRNEESTRSETPTETETDVHYLPEINVTRNETTESMTIHDDTNGNTPTTYEYTKHSEEETIEGLVHTSHSEEKTLLSSSSVGRGPTMTTSVHSSRKYENIEMSSGGTVKVSRQRREQKVHITNSSPKKNTGEPTKAAGFTTRGKGGECLRRIKREWKDAAKMGIAYDWTNMRTINNQHSSEKNDYVRIGPFGKNLLRWHFSVSGPSNSVYEGGVYHGRVLLPKDYPGSPPRVQMLTPSGRFLCGADICLSASSYHPETWSPRWTVLSLVDALRLHMLTTANEIGGVMASSERRMRYAGESRSWRSPGIVDHGCMVAEGLFPLCQVGDNPMAAVVDPVVNEEVSMDEATDKSVEGKSGGAVNNMPQHAVHVQPPSNDVAANLENKEPVNDTTEVIKKQKKAKSKTTKVAEARNTRNDGSSNLQEQHGTPPTLLKLLVVEMLKLPLRILSILLQILSVVESQLRAILDNL